MKIKIKYKKVIQHILYSMAFAFFMLYIALGLMFLKLNAASPILKYKHIILFIAAIFFIIFSVLYELKGQKSPQSLLKGLFLSACATFSTVTIACGAILTMKRQIPIGIDEFISALAICMIFATVLLSLLKPFSR